jgi:hypothetical protein
MANAAILALSAIRTPILIVDPAGFALRVRAGCVHDDPLPKAHATSGRPRLAHYLPSRTGVAIGRVFHSGANG